MVRYYQDYDQSMWLFIKRRTITASGCWLFTSRGYLRNRWIFWSRNQPLVRVNLLQKTITRKITTATMWFFDGKVALATEQLHRKRQDIGMISSISIWWQRRQRMPALPLSTLDSARKKRRPNVELDGWLSEPYENYLRYLEAKQRGHCACSSVIQKSWFQTVGYDPKTTKQILALLQDLDKN